MRREVIVSNKAAQSLQRIVAAVKENSLIGAEDVRVDLMNHMRKLALNPEHNTRRAKFDTLDGHYRSTLKGACRIYYKVEESQILVLDVIMEKADSTL